MTPKKRKPGGQPGNRNAQKGPHNRQMWSGWLPEETTSLIKTQAEKLGISEADFVVFATAEYLKIQP